MIAAGGVVVVDVDSRRLLWVSFHVVIVVAALFEKSCT